MYLTLHMFCYLVNTCLNRGQVSRTGAVQGRHRSVKFIILLCKVADTIKTLRL